MTISMFSFKMPSCVCIYTLMTESQTPFSFVMNYKPNNIGGDRPQPRLRLSFTPNYCTHYDAYQSLCPIIILLFIRVHTNNTTPLCGVKKLRK